jgi:predicted nucleotidyltransferase
MEEQKLANDNLCLKVITGSRLYGTETPTSDFDYMGVFVPPKEYVIGIHKCEQVIVKDEKTQLDYTCYNLPRYIELAMANNPNILSLLYTPKKGIVYENEYGRILRDSRALFLSKKSYHTFKGYAHSQKQKIITKNPIGSRKALVNMFNYDVKFASHLIRLLYEAIDIMVGKELVYPSPHRVDLKAIRAGKWDLGKVLSESERLEQLVDEAYVKSDLQYMCDRDKIENIQMYILEAFWSKDDY